MTGLRPAKRKRKRKKRTAPQWNPPPKRHPLDDDPNKCEKCGKGTTSTDLLCWDCRSEGYHIYKVTESSVSGSCE